MMLGRVVLPGTGLEVLLKKPTPRGALVAQHRPLKTTEAINNMIFEANLKGVNNC